VNTRLVFTIVAALTLSSPAPFLVLLAQGNPGAAQLTNPVTASAESTAAGKQIFARNCATCHGINAEGGPGNDLIPPAPDLTDDKWDHGSSDGDIFNNIRNGVPPEFNMIPWKDKLTDTDVWNVVNYLKSIAKKK